MVALMDLQLTAWVTYTRPTPITSESRSSIPAETSWLRLARWVTDRANSSAARMALRSTGG
jgi:hypothetical protein